ncbi:transaldolase [Haematococcus lacustris]
MQQQLRPVRFSRQTSVRVSATVAGAKPQQNASLPTLTNQLEALKSMSTVVADTGEPRLVKLYKPQDCTTNPSLVLKAAQSSEYAHLLQGALAAQKAHKGPAISADPTRPFAAVADLLAVDLGCQMLDIVRGRVSTEVDAHLSYDSTATYDKALHLVDLYAKRGVGLERLYIKIASTWEGIEACRRLQAQGIDCNMTLLFSFAQAAACADAGAALISPFVGRIMDWYKAKEGREFAPEEDPGVLSVKRIYTYYKTHSYPTIVMAASFRNVGEIRELAGCDNITISPQLLAELEACSDPLPRKLHPGMRDDSLTKLVISKASFDTLHSADAMAVEKLAQGIEGFAADQRKLEAMLAQAAGNA